MKLKFLLPVFALLFILSCGDDPVLPETDLDSEASDNNENIVPDNENSENGNDSDSDTDTDSEKTDDNADSTNDSGDSQPDKDANDTDPADDSENNTPEDNDTAADDDADTSDPDEHEDQDDPASDEDGMTDNDGAQNDTDQDSGEEPEDEYDFEVVLPYNGASADKTIDFGTTVRKIDVLLMVELYSSMSAAHDNLKANVKTAIIDGIREKIPDSAFGLVTLGVVEAGNAYNLVQPITTDPNDVRNAVDGITKITSGTRTYHGLALWEAASGEEDKEYLILCDNNAVCNATYKTINIGAADCTGQIGNRGGACFRDNSMPVFVMASTQTFNNFLRKKNNGDYYDEWRESVNGNTYTLEKTAVKAAAKMSEINAKFIGVSYKTTNPANGFKSVAGNTLSQDTAGNNFNISVNADDETFSAQIAEAVKNLTDNIKLDVKAQFKHAGNNYGVENTTQFVKSIYPEAGKTVKAGETASFDVTFENTIHENNDCEPHNFRITVEAKGEGLVLDSRKIKVIVPGKEEGCGSAQ